MKRTSEYTIMQERPVEAHIDKHIR